MLPCLGFLYCTDFYQTVLRQVPLHLKEKINSLMIDQNNQELNALIKKLANESLMLEWAVNQGMHTTGSQTPYDFISKTMLYNTTEISEKVEQKRMPKITVI